MHVDEIGPISLEDLRETEIDAFGHPVTVADLFVSGSCHHLAAALVETIPTARAVAVVDRLLDDGTPAPAPRIVHAAVLLDDAIVDIDGMQDRDEWFATWSNMAAAPDLFEWEPGQIPFEYHDAVHAAIARRVAGFLADLVARGAARLSASARPEEPYSAKPASGA